MNAVLALRPIIAAALVGALASGDADAKFVPPADPCGNVPTTSPNPAPVNGTQIPIANPYPQLMTTNKNPQWYVISNYVDDFLDIYCDVHPRGTKDLNSAVSWQRPNSNPASPPFTQPLACLNKPFPKGTNPQYRFHTVTLVVRNYIGNWKYNYTISDGGVHSSAAAIIGGGQATETCDPSDGTGCNASVSHTGVVCPGAFDSLPKAAPKPYIPVWYVTYSYRP